MSQGRLLGSQDSRFYTSRCPPVQKYQSQSGPVVLQGQLKPIGIRNRQDSSWCQLLAFQTQWFHLWLHSGKICHLLCIGQWNKLGYGHLLPGHAARVRFSLCANVNAPVFLACEQAARVNPNDRSEGAPLSPPSHFTLRILLLRARRNILRPRREPVGGPLLFWALTPKSGHSTVPCLGARSPPNTLFSCTKSYMSNPPDL